jgi:hypothetical protein
MNPAARHISTVDTAKLIRQKLKQEFPGVKFSVRCSSSAWEGFVDVEWTDGPTEADVGVVTQMYETRTFEHFHYDLVSVDRPPQKLVHEDGTDEEVIFGPARVHLTRWYSKAWQAELQAEFAAFLDEDFVPDRGYAVTVDGTGEAAAFEPSSTERRGSVILHWMAQRRTGPSARACALQVVAKCSARGDARLSRGGNELALRRQLTT